MKSLKIRELVLGEGIPKVCVPLMGTNEEELLKAVAFGLESGADLFEWRADCFGTPFDQESLNNALKRIRSTVKEKPLLFTFRTQGQDGCRALSPGQYLSLNRTVMNTGMIDLIDVEYEAGGDIFDALLTEAHAAGISVILSHHDFQTTSPKEKLVALLCKMQQTGADICKLAVMANTEGDVLTLLDAAAMFKTEYAQIPFIAISMGEKGLMSRLFGGVFGSSILFAAGTQSSAAGQIPAKQLLQILPLIYNSR